MVKMSYTYPCIWAFSGHDFVTFFRVLISVKLFPDPSHKNSNMSDPKSRAVSGEKTVADIFVKDKSCLKLLQNFSGTS